MRLNDPRRPLRHTGQLLLLIDNTPVPRLSMFPLDEYRIEVAAVLRTHIVADNFAYNRYSYICDKDSIALLLYDYFLDPEVTLERVFGWKEHVFVAPQTNTTAINTLTAQLDLI